MDLSGCSLTKLINFAKFWLNCSSLKNISAKYLQLIKSKRVETASSYSTPNTSNNFLLIASFQFALLSALEGFISSINLAISLSSAFSDIAANTRIFVNIS